MCLDARVQAGAIGHGLTDPASPRATTGVPHRACSTHTRPKGSSQSGVTSATALAPTTRASSRLSR